VEAELFSTPEYCSALAPLVRAQLSGTARLTCALTGQESHFDALSLECTFVCDRYAVAHQIREALARGVSAVCVRWWQSALLYGKEDEVDLGLVEAACSSLPEPDLNILLDADAGRVSHRLDSANRYESDLPRQERLALAYRDLWTRTGAPRTLGGSGRWEVVLGDGTLDEVSGKICEAAAATWPSLKKI
jgi:thymidylate kinase